MSPRSSPGRPLLALLMAVVAILPGCSLIFVDGPPEGHEQMAFDCTESPILPVLDLATAGLSVAGAIGAEDDFFSKDQNVAINAGFALATGWVGARIGGWRVERWGLLVAAALAWSMGSELPARAALPKGQLLTR